MDKIEKYLNEFAEVADEWFKERPFIKEYYRYFKNFAKKEGLRVKP